MGQQHNTHIANASGKRVRINLSDNNRWNTSQVLKPGEYVCIPTPNGRVSAAVFREGDDGKFEQKAEGVYSDDSDRSFITVDKHGTLDIARSKYGSIWERDDGLR